MPLSKYVSWFIILASTALITALVIPGIGLDILVLATIFFITSQYFLKEKTILLILAMRPLVDYWRDYVLVTIGRTNINLNSALALLLLVWTGWIIYKYRSQIKTAPLLIPISLFSALILISTLYSLFHFTSLVEAIKFIDIALLFLVSYFLIKKNIIKESELIFSFYWSSLIPISFGLYQLLFGIGIDTFDINNRIFGTFAHPNVFAFYLLLLLFVHWLYASLTSLSFWKKHPILKNTFYTVNILLLIFTYTRAAWLGFTAFLLVIGILKYRKSLIIVFIFTGILFSLFFPINQLLSKNYGINLQNNNLIARLTSRSEEADSISWRQSLITETIPTILQRPLFGYGYGTFPLVWENIRSKTHFYDDSSEAHNDYLRLALEVGLVGLALYLFILIKLFIISAKPVHKEFDNPKHLFFFASLIVFFLLSFSDNMLHHTPVMWWLWTIWGMWTADTN